MRRQRLTSAYDELRRLSQRTVQGGGARTFQYDAIGRLIGHTSDLGAFTLGYLGQTTSCQLRSPDRALYGTQKRKTRENEVDLSN